MNKLYDRIYWHNDTTPALNETNLNAMSKAIDDLDDRVISIADEVVDDIADIRQWHDDCEGYKDDALQAKMDAQAYANNASQSADSADDFAEDSEAYAVGTRDGTDVSSGDPAYHNNSLYYAEQAGEAKEHVDEIYEELREILVIPEFSVNYTTGELIYTMENEVEFTVNTTTGNLEWGVVA